MEVEVTGKLEIEQKGQAGKQENTAMQDELLKQLHEQYAVNNNANLGTIVTLVVAVIAVIGYFGYVYVHTGVNFSDDFGNLIAGEVNGVNVYYLDALLLIYLASVLVIAILIRLCIYQGVAQRKEQFITDAIRRKCFENAINKNAHIFPKGYHPYYKEGMDIVQGLYGELVKIFKVLFWVLTIALGSKLIANVIVNHDNGFWKLGAIEVALCLILVLLSYCYCYKFYREQRSSYLQRQGEYLNWEKHKEEYVTETEFPYKKPIPKSSKKSRPCIRLLKMKINGIIKKVKLFLRKTTTTFRNLFKTNNKKK